MPSDPEPLSDAEIDAALRELVGDELARGSRALGSVPPAVAAAHVRRAAEISRGDVAKVAGIDEARVRRAAGLARRRRRIGVAAGWAAASIVVLGGASTGLAAAEVLPRPAARVFAAGFDAVGLPVPSPVERAAATPPTTPTVPDDGETELAVGTVEADRPRTTEAQPEWPTTVEPPPVAAAESTDTTATTRTTAPSTTTTTTPECPEGTTSSSSSSSSSASTSTSSSSSSTSTSTTLLPNADAVPPAGCERDPGAEGAGADPEPTTTTTTTEPVPPSSSTTTTSLPAAAPDPVASADG